MLKTSPRRSKRNKAQRSGYSLFDLTWQWYKEVAAIGRIVQRISGCCATPRSRKFKQKITSSLWISHSKLLLHLLTSTLIACMKKVRGLPALPIGAQPTLWYGAHHLRGTPRGEKGHFCCDLKTHYILVYVNLWVPSVLEKFKSSIDRKGKFG